jgi:phosphoglycolate phosphatase-like HAD superfamily hydrolase
MQNSPLSQAVLFDMDGVLLDSRPAMIAAWTYVSHRYMLNIQPQRYLAYIGLPFEDILATLGVPRSLHSDIKHCYGASVTKSLHLISLYRGIPYILRRLMVNDMRIGIVTSKEFWRADYICDLFGIPYDVLITPEHTSRGKPHPEPILAALSFIDVKADRTIYIGDMTTDRFCAEAACVTFLHASWGYGADPQCRFSLSFPEEILEFLAQV